MMIEDILPQPQGPTPLRRDSNMRYGGDKAGDDTGLQLVSRSRDDWLPRCAYFRASFAHAPLRHTWQARARAQRERNDGVLRPHRISPHSQTARLRPQRVMGSAALAIASFVYSELCKDGCASQAHASRTSASHLRNRRQSDRSEAQARCASLVQRQRDLPLGGRLIVALACVRQWHSILTLSPGE